MTGLRDVHDTLDEIPEPYRELYTEKNGKWELTGISGVKTQADVARVQEALRKEKNDHAETKSALSSWGELGDRDEILTKLDRLPALEAATEGKLDDAKIDELATQRLERMLPTKTAPLERQIQSLSRERDELRDQNSKLAGDANVRDMRDSLRPLMKKAGVLEEHHEDVFMYAERHLQRDDDGNGFFVKDGAPDYLMAGSGAKDWLEQMVERRPGWLPPSVSGKSRGSVTLPGGQHAENPWNGKHWNLTEQAKLVRQLGRDKADELARQAGSKVGATHPPADAAASSGR